MADRIRVAGAQMAVTDDIDRNAETIQRAIAFAADERADVLLTPEGSLSGYTHEFDPSRVMAALEAVTAQARSRGVGLALGTCFVEPGDGRCYNQIRFYDREGALLGFHSKTLRCGSLTDPPKGEINHYAVTPLSTFRLAGIAVGGLVCNDLWANPGCTPVPDPHLTQQLAELGARIVFHAVNGGRDGGAHSREVYWPFHETNLRVRAMVGRLWIVTVDNCHPTDIPCSAPSGVIGPEGDWAVQTQPIGEQMFVHTIALG
jgi:predicted amidohydrolase